MARRKQIVARGQRLYPIQWTIPPEAGATFANQFVVQRTDDGDGTPSAHTHILSMFEVQRPILIGDDVDRKKILDRTDYIPALLRGRFLIPWPSLANLAATLIKHVMTNCPTDHDRDELAEKYSQLLASLAVEPIVSEEGESASDPTP